MKKVPYLLFSSIYIFMMFSCTNFLGGNDLKQALENSIEYANSESLRLTIAPEKPEMGTLTGESSQSVKVTDRIKLKFTTTENYRFDHWEAIIGVNTVDTQGKYVSFDESTNINTVAEIKSYASDILIRPVCKQYLQIKKANPEQSLIPNPKDRSIYIEFNDNIDLSNFRFSEEDLDTLGLMDNTDGSKKLKDAVTALYDDTGLCYAYEINGTRQYKNISITCNGESVNSSFGIPQVSENKLTLKVDLSNLIEVEEGRTKTLSVNMDKNITGTSCIGLKENYSWTYVINSVSDVSSDSIPPVLKSFMAAISPEQLKEDSKFTDDKALASYTNDDFVKNRIKNSMAIKFDAYDLETGISKVCISYTKHSTIKGTKLANLTPTIIECPSSDMVITEAGKYVSVNTSITVPYTKDYLLEIEAWVEDYNNNKSNVKTFYSAMDNNVDINEWQFHNIANMDSKNNYDPDKVYPKIIPEKMKTFTIEVIPDYIYSNFASNIDPLDSFEVYYGFDFEDINTKIDSSRITNISDNKYSFIFTEWDEDNFKENNFYFKVIVNDGFGNENGFIQMVPKQTTFINYSWYSSSNKPTGSYDFLIESDYGIVNSWSTSSSNTCWRTKSSSLFACNYYQSKHGIIETIVNNFEEDTITGKGRGYNDYGMVIDVYKNTDRIAGNGKPTLKDITTGNPITFTVNKTGTLYDYNIFEVKTSGTPTPYKSGYETWSILKIINNDSLTSETYYKTFQGTETKLLIPTDAGENLSFYLYAADDHYTNTSSDTNADLESAAEVDINTKHASLIAYNELTMRQNSEKQKFWSVNPNYDGDFIRFIPANSQLNYKNDATLYYKKINNETNTYLSDNLLTFKDGMYTFPRRNPNILIQKGYLTLEDVHSFDSVPLSLKIDSLNTSTDLFGDDALMIPVKNLEDGIYIMFVKMTTTDGETDYNSFVFEKEKSSYAIGNTNDSILKVEGTTITAKTPHNYSGDERQYARFEIKNFDSDNSKWVTSVTNGEKDQKELYATTKETQTFNTPKPADIDKTFTIDRYSGWRKVYYYETDYESNQTDWNYGYFGTSYSKSQPNANGIMWGGVEKFYYHTPVYIYPNGTMTPSETCKLKTLYYDGELTVFCDKSTLVQTFVSPRDLGTNPEDWEYYTPMDCILNPRVITSTETYELPAIPKGYYYTVIARFSDGVVKMTAVQKN